MWCVVCGERRRTTDAMSPYIIALRQVADKSEAAVKTACWCWIPQEWIWRRKRQSSAATALAKRMAISGLGRSATNTLVETHQQACAALRWLQRRASIGGCVEAGDKRTGGGATADAGATISTVRRTQRRMSRTAVVQDGSRGCRVRSAEEYLG